MNSKDFRLYISGGYHIECSPQERIDEVRSKIGSDIDVVFNENVCTNPPSRREQYKNFASVPLIILLSISWFKLLSAVTKIGLSDRNIISELGENGEIVDVDWNYHRLLAEYRFLWGKAHYGMVCVILVAFFFGKLSDGFNQLFDFGITLPSLIVLGVVTWILVGCFMMIFFIAGTMSSRNVRTINDIEDYIEENPDVENGCLIVGHSHVEELEKLAGRSDIITVVD